MNDCIDRFSVQNEVVLDRQTGLMWPRSGSLSEFPLTWEEGLHFIKELNRSAFSGYRDWKLPNRRELFSLVSHETINPSLPRAHPFVDIFTGYYWTSTTCARLPNQAWYIHFGGARVFKGMKLNSYMVWPVRMAESHGRPLFQTGQGHCYDETGNSVDCADTGQDAEFRSPQGDESSRFQENGGWVYDEATGLTWLIDANVKKKTMAWEHAFVFVDEMNRTHAYGHDDWRIPSILELEGLTDMGRHSPALPIGSPFERVQDFYWSSTTSVYDTRYAWTLYMKDGAVGVGYKPLAEFYLWPVRGNRSTS